MGGIKTYWCCLQGSELLKKILGEIQTDISKPSSNHVPFLHQFDNGAISWKSTGPSFSIFHQGFGWYRIMAFPLAHSQPGHYGTKAQRNKKQVPLFFNKTHAQKIVTKIFGEVMLLDHHAHYDCKP